jgi:spermidine/putrescine transport system substrate-binding protein
MIKYLVILLGVLLAGCGQSKQKIHVFIWPDYIDPQAVADFEREFDCQVTMDFYEDIGTMQTKLAAGGASVYDIVVPGHMTLPGLIQRGLVAPIRPENIPNLRNIDPQFLNPKFDPGNRHSVPYLWGTSGIYVRAPKGQPVEDTWGLIFDPAKQPGPFLLLEDYRLCIGAALQYKGYRINTTNPKELAEARELLLEAKKRSLGFSTSFATKGRVLGKDAALATAYNNDAMRGVGEDAETRYFVPREGSGIWLDTLSIPANAPHRDLAEKFINFMLDAKVAARIADFTRTATPNKAALEFINPEDRSNPGIYPAAEIMARLEYALDLGEANKLYDEIWTQIKAK